MKRLLLAKLPRDTRDTWLLLLVMAWVLWPLYSVLPWWCSTLSAAVLFWRGLLAWQQKPMPGRWVRVGLLLLCVLGTALSFKTLLGQDAGLTLVVTLLTLKTLELRARRDTLVVFFLCFFLMLAQFFYGQSLLSAAVMLVGVLGLLTALINAHLPVTPAPLRTSFTLAARMMVLGLPVMAVLFVLFPRVAPLWGLPAPSQVGKSGLSADLTMGSVAELALDRSVAFRVRFDGPEPQSADLYFRGPVLSTFDGRQWRAAPLGTDPGFDPSDGQALSPALAYELTLQAHHQPWLLTLDATPQAPQGVSGRVRQGADLQWLRTRGVQTVLRYQAQAYARYRYGQTLSTAQRRTYLSLPTDSNPRTQAWARTLLAQARADERQPQRTGDGAYWVNQVFNILRTGDYRYTLSPGLFGQHGVDEFWFDRRAGFCEHIAASFVVLMRALGVPARIVTGYQGGERNPLDGYWTVRQSDAHAWAEVWLAGTGWQRIDPTAAIAPERVDRPLGVQETLTGLGPAWLGEFNPRLLWRARWLWEAVNNRWNQWVLGYQENQQLQLLQWLGFASPSWQDLVRLLGLLLVLGSLTGVVWTLWQGQRQPAWLRLLDRVRQYLRRAGLAVGAQASPRELAQQLQAVGHHHPQLAPDCQAWANWLISLEQLRYAPAGTDRAPERRLAKLQTQWHQLQRQHPLRLTSAPPAPR